MNHPYFVGMSPRDEEEWDVPSSSSCPSSFGDSPTKGGSIIQTSLFKYLLLWFGWGTCLWTPLEALMCLAFFFICSWTPVPMDGRWLHSGSGAMSVKRRVHYGEDSIIVNFNLRLILMSPWLMLIMQIWFLLKWVVAVLDICWRRLISVLVKWNWFVGIIRYI